MPTKNSTLPFEKISFSGGDLKMIENLIPNPSKAEFYSACKSLENEEELDDREIWILSHLINI